MKAELIEKEFTALTKDDFKIMRRNHPRVDLKTFMEHYKVSAEAYKVKFEEIGFVLTKEERAAYQQERSKTTKPGETILTRIEMMAVRMFRGHDREQFSKLIGLRPSHIKAIENGKIRATQSIQQKYINVLQIKESELNRVRLVLSGRSERIEIDREIPEVVKNEVHKKCNGSCVKCGDKRKLHYHHIKKFSEGGLHQTKNLVLLCPACHAKEHMGEKVYNLLKSIADKLEKEGELA